MKFSKALKNPKMPKSPESVADKPLKKITRKIDAITRKNNSFKKKSPKDFSY